MAEAAQRTGVVWPVGDEGADPAAAGLSRARLSGKARTMPKPKFWV